MEVCSVSPAGFNPCPALYLHAVWGSLIESVPVSSPVSSLCCFSFRCLGLSSNGLKFQAKKRQYYFHRVQNQAVELTGTRCCRCQNHKGVVFFFEGLDNSQRRAIVMASEYDDPRKAVIS